MRITIVTSGHLVTSPRVVREACALTDAGHCVCVVSTHWDQQFYRWDSEIHAANRWRWHSVDIKSLHRHSIIKARTIAHRGLQRLGMNRVVGYGSAHNGVWKSLARALFKAPADIYIGHNLPGLLAAVSAAKRMGAKAMFDAEDWHPGELPKQHYCRYEIETRWRVLAECLPYVSAVCASSPRIAARYRAAFGIHCDVVLNTGYGDAQFCEWALRRRRQRLRNGSRRLFWFSQMVGLGRGLEPIIPMICAAHRNVSLHLQGRVAAPVRHRLQSIWRASGGAGAIEFIDFTSPRALRHNLHRYDIGLSVELADTPNRRACLANKFFTYIEAAMPQVISKTPAHYDQRARLATGGLFIDLNCAQQATTALRGWLDDSARLIHAMDALPAIYRNHYHGDDEADRLVNCVERIAIRTHAASPAGDGLPWAA